MTDEGFSVTVVIPARNAADTIAEQLSALESQREPGDWEVIVVDDASSDDTRSIAESMTDRIPLTVLSMGPHAGANAARNLGAASGVGDADDVAHPDWIQTMRSAALRYDVIGGELEETLLNPAHVVGWRPQRPSNRLPEALGCLPYAVGANLGVWRRVWSDLGGFDETWRSGATEIDFCWRAQEAGYTLGLAPGAMIHYRHRRSMTGLARQAYRWGLGDVRLASSRGMRLIRPAVARRAASVTTGDLRIVLGRSFFVIGYSLGIVTGVVRRTLGVLRSRFGR